jgi:hypothetical protein
MPDLIGHLNIGQHQRRYLRVCVLSMRSTVMMDRMGGLVHENRDFCGRKNKIEASVHENSHSGGQSFLLGNFTKFGPQSNST